MAKNAVGAIAFALSVVLVVCLSVVFGACSKKSEPVVQSSPEHHVQDEAATASHEEGTHLNNPNFTEEMMFKASMTEGILLFCVADGIGMFNGGAGSFTYETLISEGLLPIVFANRYTGEDVVNSREYSKGDIFIENDADTGWFRFYQHMGELDAAYEPGAVPPGERVPWAGDPVSYTTDGKTLFLEGQRDAKQMGHGDPGPYRERFGIPPDDEARARIYLVYRTANEIMYHAGNIIDSVPVSLDGYISLLGRRNDNAWVNPYTGGPMEAVEWTAVPCYYQTEPRQDPMYELYASGETDLTDAELAGNYSYTLGPSPFIEGEDRAYAQFYFYLPDGSIAAYLAIGQGPLERIQGSQGWAAMAEAGAEMLAEQGE